MLEADLAVMRQIDELHLLYPFAGSRMLRDLLRQERRSGAASRRHADEADEDRGDLPPAEHVETGTGSQGLSVPAVQAGSGMSEPSLGDRHHLYLHGPGLAYLVTIVDEFTRRVLAWRVSISLDVEFCIEALEEALARHGKPAIFNSDQGSQFTSMAFTTTLHREEISISVDGKRCWRDYVLVERLWCSVKYKEVNLHAYASVPEARAAIGRYFAFYYTARPHSALGGRTPDQIYFNQPLLAAA